MPLPDNVKALLPVVEALERLDIDYYVGGSIASSLYGVPRSTIDVDLIADLDHGHIEAFTSNLKDSYYVEPDMIREALAHRSSFNMIHLESMYKVDVFIMPSTAFAESVSGRIIEHTLPEGDERPIRFSSAEDVILHKLTWYRDGGEVSERQWSDIVGVLRVQGDGLDRAYLDHWAGQLDVMVLLYRAWREVESDE